MYFSLILLVSYLALLYLVGVRLLCQLKRKPKSIAFFHPYCNAGGGGERVLWRAIFKLQKTFKENYSLIIYTGDSDVTSTEIITNAQNRFNITVDPKTIEFVFLRFRSFIEPKPFLTMFLQMFGGLWLGIEALWRLTPDVFIDTTGCPLTLPLFCYIGGCKVGTYVHYPTITNEMINLVRSRKSTYNNGGWIANKQFFTTAKLFYYKDLMRLYEFCGESSNIVMTNGSWTNEHISKLWRRNPEEQTIVFPPCDVEELSETKNYSEEILKSKNRVQILSVGQIRPEKNHELQLQIFADVRRLAEEENLNFALVLIIAGGCRNAEDLERLESLKQKASNLYGLTNDVDVEWQINISFSTLKRLLQTSMIGLHTMWNEHFGISVVEGLAAGSIMVAHDSAGPKLDIVRSSQSNPTNESVGSESSVCGFLADTKEEYARQIIDIIKMKETQRQKIRKNAIDSAQRFSNSEFDRQFSKAVMPLIALN